MSLQYERMEYAFAFTLENFNYAQEYSAYFITIISHF